MSLNNILTSHKFLNNSYARLALSSCWSRALTSPLTRGAKPICILGLWDEDALLSSHLLILTPCALGRSWVLYVYKTPVSTESECSCVFGRLVEFSTNKTPISTESECSCVFGRLVWVLYVYKTPISTESECSCVFGRLVWVLYVSSDSILETSPSLCTRPPTTLAWLFSLLRHLR